MGDFNCDAPLLAKKITFSLIIRRLKRAFKSLSGTCIDLILSNQKFSLQNISAFDSGPSDFHHLISAELICTYLKFPPRNVTYRSYRNFDESIFLNDLANILNNVTCNYEKFNRHARKIQ